MQPDYGFVLLFVRFGMSDKKLLNACDFTEWCGDWYTRTQQ